MCEKTLVLEAKNLTKKFITNDGKTLTACDNISLNFYKGKTLGVVGESGCGKSTFMKMLVQMLEPTTGEILFYGKDISKLKRKDLHLHRRNIQMIFQNSPAAFHPRMKVKDIICEPLLNFNLIKKNQKDDIAKKYLRMVELPEEFANRYPHSMSGGQRQRVGIARALTLKPEIIICDEATSALDVSVQKTVIELIRKLQKENQISIGFICHDIALVSQVSHQVAVMYLGNVVEVLSGENIKTQALHPYTKGLLNSVLYLGMDKTKKIDSISGDVPSSLNMPVGCPFQNRCESCMKICRQEKPLLIDYAENHQVACHLFSGI